MLLQHLHIVGNKQVSDIHIDDGFIKDITTTGSTGADGPSLVFKDAIVLPGLINSHDHLDFNLFPPMAGRIYNNYIEWGADIQQLFRKEIDVVNKVPAGLRIQWGVCKNLLAGVTTVVNHGKKIAVNNDLIDVFQSCHSLHSVNREKNWKFKLNNPFARPMPWVIHAGEGTDTAATVEIDELLRWNLLKRKLVAVHGVAMNTEQAKRFKGLVWCPVSNFFLLGRTASISELKKKTSILFGTDSTLTGDWNIWEHLRQAKKTGQLSEEQILYSLTASPANIWGLHDRGILAPGKKADLLVVQPNDPADLLSNDPGNILLLIKNGSPVLFDESLLPQLGHEKGFFPFSINNSRKFIKFDLPGLMSDIHQFLPSFMFPIRSA